MLKEVERIWAIYDADKNGLLDRAEARSFVRDLLKGIDRQDLMNQEFFEECFDEFDKDGDQVLAKDEMALFVKKYI